MKKTWIILFCSTLSFASIENINTFKADFIQSVTDDKNVSLIYNGNIVAKKPQNAVWNYVKPIEKNVYINRYSITIVEPEIEQVIIRKIETNFDFFMMIKNARKIDNNKYIANYKKTKFIISTNKSLISSISYKDEFENNIKIIFKNQQQNIDIEDEVFKAKYPLDFDIIID
jgi:outer membrane lipoprotein carrier protein